MSDNKLVTSGQAAGGTAGFLFGLTGMLAAGAASGGIVPLGCIVGAAVGAVIGGVGADAVADEK